jgi:hypothetical protein
MLWFSSEMTLDEFEGSYEYVVEKTTLGVLDLIEKVSPYYAFFEYPVDWNKPIYTPSGLRIESVFFLAGEKLDYLSIVVSFWKDWVECDAPARDGLTLRAGPPDVWERFWPGSEPKPGSTQGPRMNEESPKGGDSPARGNRRPRPARA